MGSPGRLTFDSLGALQLNGGTVDTLPDFGLVYFGDDVVRASLAGGLRLRGDEASIHLGTVIQAHAGGSQQHELQVALRNAALTTSHSGFRIGSDVVRFTKDARTSLLISRPHSAPGTSSAFIKPANDDGTISARLTSRSSRSLKPELAFERFVLGIRRHGADEHRVLFAGVDAPGAWFSGDVLSAHVTGGQWAVAAESAVCGQPLASSDNTLHVDGCQLVLPGADLAELRHIGSPVPISQCVIELGNVSSLMALDSWRLRVRRALDMVDLEFTFENVAIKRDKRRRLRMQASNPNQPSLVRVHFPPQVMGDEVYFVQRDLTGQRPSINPEDPHWKDVRFPQCESRPTPFERDDCRRREIAKLIDQERSDSSPINEFATRPVQRLKPRAYAAERTRLVLANAPGVPFQREWSLDALLEWNDLHVRVNPRSAPVNTKWLYQASLALLPLAPPTKDETSIEAPFGVQLSPLADPACVVLGEVHGSQFARLHWITSRLPQNQPTSTAAELWHARLREPQARAIWARGFKPESFSGRFGGTTTPGPPHPNHEPEIKDPVLRLTFDDRDRHEFVALSSVFGLQAIGGSAGVIKSPDRTTPDFFSPGAIESDRVFALSSVGASLRIKGNWDPPLPKNDAWPALTVESLRSRHVWGSEVFGRVVYRGFLFPLGVRVSLVKLTERQFEWDPLDRQIKAPKFQRLFIVLPKKVKYYPAVRQPYGGRNSDLVSLEFTLERTPDLWPPDQGTGIDSQPGETASNGYDRPLRDWSQDLFWPQIANNEYFSFPFVAKDQGNRTTLREGPQLFVSNFLAYRADVMARVADYYNQTVPVGRKTIAVGGQRVGYAPPARTTTRRAETAFETSGIVLGATLTAFDGDPINIVSITAGNPPIVRTARPHNLTTGNRVALLGTATVPAVDGLHIVTRVDAERISIPTLVTTAQTSQQGTLALVEEDAARRSGALPRWIDPTLQELQSAAQPPFYPYVSGADVHVPAIQQMAGSDVPSTTIAYDDVYRDHGFSSEKNQVEIFARVLTNLPFNVGGNSANVGGVAAPNTQIRALSRTAGLVGGTRPQSTPPTSVISLEPRATGAPNAHEPDSIAQLQSGRFDPAAMFATSVGDAKLLGTIRLADVIRVALSQLTGVPKFVDEAIFEGVEAITTLFCGAAPRIQTVLTAIAAAVGELPDSTAKQMLLQRIATLQAAANQVRAACEPPQPAEIAAGVAAFVRAGEDFVNDVRAISDAPALLLPPALASALETLSAALTPFLPPFNPANVLTQEIRRFLDAVIQEQTDQIDQQLQTALQNLSSEYQPTIVQTRRAAAALRDRLRAESAAIEANLIARFSEATDVVGAHLDELLVLQQAAASNCSAAAAAVTRAAIEHFLPVPTGVARIQTLIVELDSRSRDVFRMANNPSVPADVQARALAIHEQLRVLCEAAISALKRVVEAPPAIGQQLATLCSTNWAQSTVAETGRQALRDIKTVVLQALSPSEVVRIVRPLQQFVDETLAALPPSLLPTVSAAPTAVATPTEYAVLRAHVEALVRIADDLGREAIAILTRSNGSQPTSQEIGSRIQRTADLVARIKSVSFSVRLNEILDDLAEAVNREWRALEREVTIEVLERVALAEQAIIQRVFDAVVPGTLQGFATVANWYVKWQAAAGGLITQPIRNALEAVWNALPAPGAMQTLVLAQPLRNDLIALRDTVGRARTATAQNPLTGGALRLLAEVGMRGETVARNVLEHLSRGELNQLVSLDGVVHELEELVKGITPIRRAFRYDWSTALKSFPSASGSEVFLPLGDGSEKHLTISSRVEVALAPSGVSTTTELFGEIRNFKLLLIPGFRLVAITFENVTFRTRNGRAPEYDVKIRGFEFLEAFAFVKALGDLLDDGGNGPYLRISTDPPAIEAGFRFGADTISFGAFTIQNLRVLLAFRLPLNSQPATFVFALASREKPCLLSAGIYGGGFFLALNATPSKLLSVEGAIEFGAVTAVKFGPLDARGRVVAGLYFRIAAGNSALQGYVLAAGSGRIAWFAISVVLRVGIESDGSNARGSASFEVSFEISSFVKLTFGFTAGYTFAGGGTPGARLAQLRSVPQEPSSAGMMASVLAGLPCGRLPNPDVPSCPTKNPKWWKARERYATVAVR